jgi:hypothetical protein
MCSLGLIRCCKGSMTFAIYSSMIVSLMTGVISALPQAWVARCKKCGCTVTCRALDPQTEHSEPENAEPPPAHLAIVSCSCCWSDYRYNSTEVFKGPPSPSSACLESRRRNTGNGKNDKKRNSAILIAASLIAAVRLNREEIKASPSVAAKIADSIRLAEMIQARLQR